ncbi:MAG TPA: hypothetical protein VEO53_07325 [Candidatus Binatia bacterium]|nr:hypothetical protein [Candidatus Binatia bacterium]
MSVVFLSLATVFLARARHWRRAGKSIVRKISTGPGAALLLTALGSYVALVVHDNISGPVNRASVSSITGIGTAILLAVVLIGFSYGRGMSFLVRPVLIAVSGSAAIVTFVTTRLSSAIFLSVSAAGVYCMIVAIIIESYLALTIRQSPKPSPGWEIFGGLTLASICISMWVQLSSPLSGHERLKITVVGIIAITLIVGTLFGFLGYRAAAAMPITLVGLLVIAVAAAAVWFNAPGTGSQPVTTAVSLLTGLVGLIIGLATLVVKVRTDGILGVPADPAEPDPRLESSMIRPAGLALALIAFFGLGAFSATLAFVFAVNRSLPFPSQTPTSDADRRLLLIGASSILIAAIVFIVNERLKGTGIGRLLAAVARIVIPAAMCVFLLDDPPRQHFTVLLSVEAAVVGLLMFLWTSNSVANNVWLMQGRKMGIVALSSSVSLALLSGSATAWALTTGIEGQIHARNPGQATMAALAALLMAGCLVVLLGSNDGIWVPHYTELPVWRGLAQDALSSAAIILILIFPVIYLWSFTTFWKGLIAALPIVTFFAAPFWWVMKANREHPQVEALRQIEPRARAEALLTSMRGRSLERLVSDQRVLRKALTNPCAEKSEDFIRVLAAHTRNQNRIATIMILAPIAGALQYLFALGKDSARLAQLVARIAWPSNR